MERRHLIWSGGVGVVALLAACQSGAPAANAEPEHEAVASESVPHQLRASEPSSRPIVAQRPASTGIKQAETAAGGDVGVDVGFDVGQGDIAIDPETGYAIAAFPPTIPDRDWHRDAWLKNDCLRCHETGVGQAPMIRHRGLPEITFASKCRSCHVLIPGKTDVAALHEEDSVYEDYAFPPMLPNDVNHAGAWNTKNCLLCHEDGVRGAPIVEHKTLPAIALTAKCRSCHVQVRSVDAKWMDR